jgi:hypothetical protein
MTAWLSKLNRRHVHLIAPVAIALAFLIVIGLAAISLKQYFFWGTDLNISFVGRDAVLKFNLGEEDKKNLTKLAQRLNFPWQGENLSVELKSSDVTKWQSLLPVDAKLNFPNESETVIHATVKNIPLSPVSRVGVEDKFIPQGAIAALSSAELETLYNLPGKEVFSDLSERPTLASFYVQGKLSLVFVALVKDRATLDAKLAALRDNHSSPVLGYSNEDEVASGFSETDLAGIKTYTLTRPDLKSQPTFGDLNGRLLVASSPEAWQAAENAYTSGKNLGASDKYQQAISDSPKLSSGFLYLDLTGLAGRGQKIQTDLAPFIALRIDDSWFQTGIDMGRLSYLAAAWFGIDPIHTGSGQSELWVKIKAK